jgi:hypothetical protein
MEVIRVRFVILASRDAEEPLPDSALPAHLLIGEFNFDRGWHWLAQAHPLQALELAQRAVEGPFQAGFVPEQAVQMGRRRDAATKDLQLGSISLDGSAGLSVALEVANLSIDLVQDILFALFRCCVAFPLALFLRDLGGVEPDPIKVAKSLA